MTPEEYVNSDITKYWDDRHAVWAKNPDIGHFAMKDLWFEERYAHLLPIPRGQHPQGYVLDYGCGCGQYSVPLLRRFATYSGVDTSESAIQLARRYFTWPARLQFRLMPANTVDSGYMSNTFDCVITITVLQHQPVPIRVQMIEEIKRVLKRGGRYIGLEMMGATMAPDMPQMSVNDWLEAWKPLTLIHDIPFEHPDWAADNIWYSI